MNRYLIRSVPCSEVDSALRRLADVLWEQHKIDDKDSLLLLASFLSRQADELLTLQARVANLEAELRVRDSGEQH